MTEPGESGAAVEPPVSPAPLGRAAVRGALWTILGKGFDRFVELIRIVVLAHLLTKEDLGTFFLVAAVSIGLQTITYTGFRLALIRRQTDPSDLYDTTFTIESVRGVLIAGATCLAAPWIADFFDAPITGMLQVESLAMVLLGAVNIGTIEFDRHLNFRKSVTMTRAGALASLVVAIALAAIFRSPWALVIADVARAATVMGLSYLLHPYRPRFSFAWNHARELIAFGVWLTIDAVGFFLLQQFDSLYVGRVLGPAALGSYRMAYLIALLPTNSLREVIFNVTFPIFSKIVGDSERLGRAYRQIVLVCAAAVVPAMLLLVCYSDAIVYLVLSGKWMSASPLIQVLAFFGFVQLISFTIEPTFGALGVPHLTAIPRYVQIATVVPLVWIFTNQWQERGTALAVALAGAVPLVIQVSLLARQIPGVLAPLSRSAMGLLVPLAGLVGVAWSVRWLLPAVPVHAAIFGNDWFTCLGGAMLGGAAALVVYGLLLLGVERWYPIGLREIGEQVLGVLQRRKNS